MGLRLIATNTIQNLMAGILPGRALFVTVPGYRLFMGNGTSTPNEVAFKTDIPGPPVTMFIANSAGVQVFAGNYASTNVALTAPRSISLPRASSVTAGQSVVINDEFRAISSTNTLTLLPASPASGTAADTINGAASLILSEPGAVLTFYSNGSNAWSTDARVARRLTGPIASTDDFVPRWSGTTGLVLGAGLPVGTANGLALLDASGWIPASALGLADGRYVGVSSQTLTVSQQSQVRNNIGLGSGAPPNSTGSNNTAIGVSGFYSNTVGSDNSALGFSALYSNTTGNNNSAIGRSALVLNTTGSNNSALGFSALYSNTIGNNNSAIGVNALVLNTTGSNNSALGASSLYSNTTGSNNTALGSGSLSSSVSYNNVTGVGANAAVTGSNQVQLGDSSTTTYVYGTVQNRSDERDKADIRDTVLGLEFISKLRPVDFKWDLREEYRSPPPVLSDDADEKQKAQYEAKLKAWREASKLETIVRTGKKKGKRWHSGLIAQEVTKVIEGEGLNWGAIQDHAMGGGEETMSLGYDQFIAPLIKAVQQLSAQNAELSARLAKLEKTV